MTPEYRFNGPDYDPVQDNARLNNQMNRVFECMKDGVWRTLSEIEELIGDPQSSISAQLRHLRKERFGKHTVNRRSRGNRAHGLYEYQLVRNTNISNHSTS